MQVLYDEKKIRYGFTIAKSKEERRNIKMLLYGVCVSKMKVNNEKAVQFLKELADAGLGADDYYEIFLEDTSGDEDYTFSRWIEDFESNGYYGLSAFLQEVISFDEKIDISCDDPNGIQYLGLSADVPWNFNEKTRNMSENEYNENLRKYINKVTDDELTICWRSISDDSDY